MGEAISFAEIKKRFDSEWILLEDPQTREGLEIESGAAKFLSCIVFPALLQTL